MMADIIKARAEHVEGIAKVCSKAYRNTYRESYPEEYIEEYYEEGGYEDAEYYEGDGYEAEYYEEVPVVTPKKKKKKSRSFGSLGCLSMFVVLMIAFYGVVGISSIIIAIADGISTPAGHIVCISIALAVQLICSAFTVRNSLKIEKRSAIIPALIPAYWIH